MKLIQIVNDICHYDMTKLYNDVNTAKKYYPPNVQIVEAPDYVFEGWGYNTETGDFIKPTPPEGWLYDDATGTFYRTVPPEPVKSPEELTREIKQLKAQLEASSKTNQFLEDCLVEVANIVYA